jgi:hypothetical protein
MGCGSLRVNGDESEFGSHEFPPTAFSEKKGLSFRFYQGKIEWIEK